MTGTWSALAVVTGIVLAIDLLTTQVRKCARRISISLDQAQEENESDVREN